MKTEEIPASVVARAYWDVFAQSVSGKLVYQDLMSKYTFHHTPLFSDNPHITSKNAGMYEVFCYIARMIERGYMNESEETEEDDEQIVNI